MFTTLRWRFTSMSCCVLGLFTGAAFAGGVIFEEQTTTRFPDPNPSEYTNQLSIADIDADGDLDILFANGGNFGNAGTPQLLRIYINDGNGFFTDESVERTGGLTFLARGVETGDADGDGDLDIVVAQDFNRQPFLLINTGGGFFDDETDERLPAANLGSARAQFGDIDNDGDLDLYFCHGGSSRWGCAVNRIYVNDGDGFYTDETDLRHPAGNVCEPMDAIFGDIDGDFDLDIRTSSTSSNQSKLYENDGAGVFSDISAGVPNDDNCYSYDFGDIDGDGLLDLLGANGGPGVTEILLHNNGDGTFSNWTGNINPNPSADDNDSKFFDYDNDGDLDLIIAALFGAAERIYNNDGAGVFTEVTGLISGNGDASLDIGVGDLTGDGRLDIVTAQGESGNFQNRIYINVRGPVDTIAPNVVQTEQLDDTDDAVGPYFLRTVIYDGVTSDRGFFDDGITLHYSIDGGREMQTPMAWVGNSQWRAGIPGQAAGGVVEYFVTGSDMAGNLGTGETLSFTIEGGGLLGDIDGDGIVGTGDLILLLGAWGPCENCKDCPADLDNDCSVGTGDLILLLGNWG